MMNVTLITGFLGAGKTTFLSRLIREHASKRKLGVIVNDLSELEVDGELLREGHFVSEKEGTLISLFNGSISSDRSADFSRAVAQMAERKIEHILVETSGGSHPTRIIEELKNAPGVTLGAVATLVDARALYHDYDGGPGLVRQLARNENDGESSSENLLADQIQAASVVVLTKIDLVPAESLALMFKSVGILNPAATLAACAYGKMDASILFDAPPYQPPAQRLTSDPDSLPEIQSIVIRDPRPLHPQRFLELYQNHLTLGVYRSKGFIWLASRPDQVLLWNQAGGAMGIELLAIWRSHILAHDTRLLAEEKELLKSQMERSHPDFGDRSCEVTVIGNADEVELFCSKFRSCFCNDEEIEGWKKGMEFPDPWPKNLKKL
jgi:G3E family GTPase